MGGFCDFVTTVTSFLTWPLVSDTSPGHHVCSSLLPPVCLRREKPWPSPEVSPQFLPRVHSSCLLLCPGHPDNPPKPRPRHRDPLASISSLPASIRGLSIEHSVLMFSLRGLFFYFLQSTRKYLAFLCPFFSHRKCPSLYQLGDTDLNV